MRNGERKQDRGVCEANQIVVSNTSNSVVSSGKEDGFRQGLVWSKDLIDMQDFASGGSELFIRLAHGELGEGKPIKLIVSLTVASETKGITNKLGEGGFGPVYKGKLQEGKEIAVKRLSSSSGTRHRRVQE
ncbi:uncharacterized protein Pyn_15048 [Prunus yedoensis var. nudiflora]|uniref:Protein kinase domain-containing protein n=1 Tax=Prunus yedoensis var. nudiflora TaxID=2094558 RepID=A0A314ZNP0_PRUYE|nr:uncharacterized protein Pyn_15048 [Prunus yedoensis var. nudiflora]